MPAPSPRRLFLWFLFLSALVFLRPPTTNFIFDEQEALLGNPYLNGSSAWLDAFGVDFWGRAPARTIGAYRPLPNLLWWPLRGTLAWNTPWVFCLLNLMVHAATATLLASSLAKLRGNQDEQARPPTTAIWAVGTWFVVSATSAEAVCSVVGLADLLVGFFSAAQIFIVMSLGRCRRAGHWGGALLLVFSTTFLGLLSKETMIASLIWVPLMSFLMRSTQKSAQGIFGLPAAIAVAICAALACFVIMRTRLFPAEAAEVETFVRVGKNNVLGQFFSWFGQPKMPADPINNPLLLAAPGERWATGFRLAFEQLVQMMVPLGLNADHSFPQETVTGWGVSAWLGCGLFLVVLLIVGRGAWQIMKSRDPDPQSRLLACAAALFFGAYLPVSNLFVLLPTIRGDRLLYTPGLGVALALGVAWGGVSFRHRFVQGGVVGYLAIHVLLGRLHALDYRDDVAFWRATSSGNPASAKAHLNLGVMIGARGDERGRLLHTQRAVQLAPEWSMGRIYLADVHCRLGESEAAWRHYRTGFSQVPNSKALTALGLQCLWDTGGFARHRADLLELATQHPDTWLDYFVTEMALRGSEHEGIPKKYRPRKYNARALVK